MPPVGSFRGPFAAAERKSSRDALEELDRAGHFSTSTTCFPPWQDDRPRWLLVSTADHHDLSISDHRMSLSPVGLRSKLLEQSSDGSVLQICRIHPGDSRFPAIRRREY